MTRLPPAYAALDALAPHWSLATEELRFRRRVSSSLNELEGFYRQVAPRLEEMIDYLNGLQTADPDQLEPADRALFDLVLMAMEAASALDLEWDTTDIEDAWPVERLEFLAPSKAPART
ncbi:MAG: hypothetical protein AB7P21_22105 [Lautropia sp.]